MRDRNDIIDIRFEVMGSVQLDMERVEEDPAWERMSRPFNLEHPEERDRALAAYINLYLSRELMLAEAPMTNGPATVMFSKVEVCKANARNR